MTQYEHIDLFSGIGGFSLGLHLAGVPISKTYFSEKDKHAISVYKRNFPDAEYIGPVESIPGRRFKGRKLIVTFGFPCQDLSIAGKGKGFDGSRSSLFFEAMRIVDELRPDIFIFENVKGFYSSNDGKDFTIALQTIADIGVYECQWQLLNTSWFLPQNRERVFLIGSLGSGNRPKVFPIREKNQFCNRSRTAPKEIYPNNKAITQLSRQYSNWGGDFIEIGDYRHDEGLRIREDGICPTLAARARQDGSGQPIIMQNANAVTPDAYLTSGARNRDEDGKAVLTSMCDRRIRRLTPIECERLQGFPDNWTQHSHDDKLISDTKRYKMCGNAVSVPVIKAMGERLI